MEGLPNLWGPEQWLLFCRHAGLHSESGLEERITLLAQHFYQCRLNVFPAPEDQQIQARSLAQILRLCLTVLAQTGRTDVAGWTWVEDVALLAGVRVFGDSWEAIRRHPYLGARLKHVNATSMAQRYATLNGQLPVAHAVHKASVVKPYVEAHASPTRQAVPIQPVTPLSDSQPTTPVKHDEQAAQQRAEQERAHAAFWQRLKEQRAALQTQQGQPNVAQTNTALTNKTSPGNTVDQTVSVITD